MPRFICFQRGIPTASSEADGTGGSPMADFQSAFASWMETHGANLPDMGGRFGATTLVLPDGASTQSGEGVKDIAGGYMIIAADDLDAAVAIARAFPGLVRPGSGVEVVEIREPQ